MGFEARMNSPVFAEVSVPAEGLPAVAASVGLLSAVNPLVDLQGGRMAEGFPTLAALVRLLPGVDGLVFKEG